MANSHAADQLWFVRNPWKTLGFLAATVTVFVSIHPMLSPDVFMYVAIADQWIKNGLPTSDPFIIDPSGTFQIMHEWLSYFIFWVLHELGGFDATILFKSALFAAMSLVVTRFASKRKTHVFVFASSLALALTSAHFRMTERTSIFSDLFELSTLALAFRLFSLEELSFKRTCVALFALFALWTNLHAGWLFGWTIVGVAVVFRWLRDRSQAKWFLLLFFATLGLFVHPQGVFGVLYPFEFSQTMRAIYQQYYVEWAPVCVDLLLNFIEVKVFIGFAAVFSLASLVVGFRRSRLEGLFISTLLAIVVGPTFVHSRFIVVSSFGLAMITCSVFRDFQKPTFRQLMVVNAVVSATILFFVTWPIPNQESPVKFGVESSLMATTTLDELGKLPPGNVFNSHEFGGAIAWKYEGRYKVVFHGFDTDPSRFLNDYFPAFENEAACLRLINKYKIRYALLDKHGGAKAIWGFLEKYGWKIQAYDSAAVLLTAPAN